MSQTDKIIRAMLKSWQSTASLIHCGGGNTPLTRLSKWRKDHFECVVHNHYAMYVYRLNGKLYDEITRWVDYTNAEGNSARYKERRLVAVK